MYISGEITSEDEALDDTDTSFVKFRDALNNLGDLKQLNLHINSPGGNVFEGIAICNMLKQSKAHINVYIDALAASIASVIAMAGDKVYMPANSNLMIHNPMTALYGNATELRKAADDLDQIGKSVSETYLEKAGDKLDKETLQKLLDNETWLTAQQAVDYGLADEVISANKAVASLDNPFAKNFKHIPKQLLVKKGQTKEQAIDYKALAEQAKAESQMLAFNLSDLRKEIKK